jgi:transposase
MKKFQLRDVTGDEQQQLQKELKSPNKTVVWRSQAVLMHCDEELIPQQIADRLGYSREMVRQVLQGFEMRGMSAIYPQSRAPKTDQRAYRDVARDQLQALVRQSPRAYGVESSLWTLALLAQVSEEQGLTDSLVHPDTVSETLHQLGVTWKKAKRTIQSPDENYTSKKNDAIGSN